MIIVILLLFVAFVVLKLRMIYVFQQMMDTVNQKRDKADQIPDFGVSPLRDKVIKLHRLYFPASRLRRDLYIAWILARFVFFSILVLSIKRWGSFAMQATGGTGE